MVAGQQTGMVEVVVGFTHFMVVTVHMD